jgi:uncharacterized membrane protein YvbJ
MVICSICGTEEVDNFTYCSLCGAKLDEFPVKKDDKGVKVGKKQLLLALGIGIITVIVASI